MSRRAVLALAAVLLLPAAAQAQFTSFVAPPRPSKDTLPLPRTVATADTSKARADSIERVSLTNMKAWVDSAAVAAGSRIPPRAAMDSAAGDVALAPRSASSQTTFRDGATAPNTATPIPLLLLAGVGSAITGLRLLRRRS